MPGDEGAASTRLFEKTVVDGQLLSRRTICALMKRQRIPLTRLGPSLRRSGSREPREHAAASATSATSRWVTKPMIQSEMGFDLASLPFPAPGVYFLPQPTTNIAAF